jgi:glycosyltransferase involved in cell wall biosynthesis
MRCPRLAELPLPPPGKTGWPWTVETPALPAARLNGSPWPRISIVTPSYNQGQFIEETIRSVLLQGYPDLEYIIIDGGSTDQSVEIIGKYEPWLTYWVSEKDRGQTHAINKGFDLASGEIFAWVNSDDQLLAGALQSVSFDLDGCQVWLVGGSIAINAQGDEVEIWRPDIIPNALAWLDRFSRGVTYLVPQPSTFWPRSEWTACGPLDERLDFCFDHAFFLLLCYKCGPPKISTKFLSLYRLHQDTKTSRAPLRFKIENTETALLNAGLAPLPFKYLIILTALRSRARFRLFEVQGGNASLFSYGRLALRSPLLVFDRMFWGAVKQGIKWRRAIRAQ